ncbi:MAG: HAD family phosphatase [Candidatus Riflebacteria bacterium]|nr:HAD family phosphatase [Candidatus Riflebacteria bacterium]
MLTHPVRMVLFDYGNVISTFDHGRFLGNLESLGLRRRDELWRSLVEGPEPVLLRFECGQVAPEAFFDHIGRFFPVPAPEPETLIGAFCDQFEPIRPTRALLKNLRGRYRIGLLSNTNATHFARVIRDAEVFPCFDQITVSFEVGAMKPDPRIFRDALAKFNGRPEEVLYLDDIAAYVEAGRRLGLQAIQVTDPAVLMPAVEAALLATPQPSSPCRR